MGKTKKVGSTGRFGARYGRSVKLRVLKIESRQKQKQQCPRCGLTRAKRLSKGIYHCKKCNAKFAGGAYLPSTLTGSLIRKMVIQKKFLPHAAELIKATEIAKGKVEAEGTAEGSEAAGAAVKNPEKTGAVAGAGARRGKKEKKEAKTKDDAAEKPAGKALKKKTAKSETGE